MEKLATAVSEACINRIIWVGTDVLFGGGCGGMVDAADSKSASVTEWGFKSLQPYQQEPDERGL